MDSFGQTKTLCSGLHTVHAVAPDHDVLKTGTVSRDIIIYFLFLITKSALLYRR
jgi:hypothetical protein